MPSFPHSALARLNDSRTVAHGFASTGLLAGLTLVEPRSLRVGGRLVYRLATAGLTAWTMWAALRTEDDGSLSPVSRGALAVGAAGAVLGIAEAGEAVDARLHDGLMRAGVSRPRLVLAAAAAAISLASWRVGNTPLGAPAEEPSGLPAERHLPLSDDVRGLAAMLLEATEGFGAPELREQLAHARAVGYEGTDDEVFWPGIAFAVPATLPLAVPGDATFPVIGRYRALGGRTFDLALGISDGRLSHLHVTEGRDWTADDRADWVEAARGVHELEAWPDPEKLELLVETPGGYLPVS